VQDMAQVKLGRALVSRNVVCELVVGSCLGAVITRNGRKAEDFNTSCGARLSSGLWIRRSPVASR